MKLICVILLLESLKKEAKNMADVKQRMIDIANSVPEDYFDGLEPT